MSADQSTPGHLDSGGEEDDRCETDVHSPTQVLVVAHAEVHTYSLTLTSRVQGKKNSLRRCWEALNKMSPPPARTPFDPKRDS